ncbi:MAG: thioredoxin domain-containing protein [Caulobacteraceae bacterium]|nr:thioredoxin domain-containing protein [Caulobacteraceae bacterium]
MRQYVCPNCGAANRTPDGKDPRAAKCGRCGGALFAGHPTEVNAKDLRAHRASTKGAALLVDVWAPWCGPCRAMAPQFSAAAARLEPDVRLLKLNAEAEPQAATEFGVSGIPALLLFKDGKILARAAGLMNADQIVAWTRQALAQVTA